MTTARIAGRLADGILSIVWAPACASCGVILECPSRGIVCSECWARVRPCAEWRPPLASGSVSVHRSAGWYEGTLRTIIHAFKYQSRRSLAEPLALLMREAGRELLGAADVVVPVPLHSVRRWTRGFNQARDLAAGLGMPVADVLRRIRHTPPQTTLASPQRRANVRGVFSLDSGRRLRRAPALKGRTVILTDDVMTTGATLDACGGVLRAAGAREVWALTAARVEAARPP